jgi:hypothetical protein
MRHLPGLICEIASSLLYTTLPGLVVVKSRELLAAGASTITTCPIYVHLGNMFAFLRFAMDAVHAVVLSVLQYDFVPSSTRTLAVCVFRSCMSDLERECAALVSIVCPDLLFAFGGRLAPMHHTSISSSSAPMYAWCASVAIPICFLISKHSFLINSLVRRRLVFAYHTFFSSFRQAALCVCLANLNVYTCHLLNKVLYSILACPKKTVLVSFLQSFIFPRFPSARLSALISII